MSAGEFALIDWFREQTPRDPTRVPVGPGDDCAVVTVDGRRVLLTTDVLLDGTHFGLLDTDPVLFGRKAMAVSLSDIAAMAGRPVAAVVGVGLPPDGGATLARALYRGLREAADAFDCALVGGDVTAWTRKTDRLTLTVAMMGEPGGCEPVLRSGARVGDRILVTGRLGGSSLGRHLTFDPRVAEARALAQTVELHAMIDVSDGLSSDLGHICRESGVGAVVRAADLPIHADADTLAATSGRPSLHHALNDGEDFELLFTVAPDAAALLLSEPPVSILISEIGEITEGDPLLELEDGSQRPLVPGGYEHDVRD